VEEGKKYSEKDEYSEKDKKKDCSELCFFRGMFFFSFVRFTFHKNFY